MSVVSEDADVEVVEDAEEDAEEDSEEGADEDSDEDAVVDEDSPVDGESELDSAGRAYAMPGVVATAAPTPSATDSAPT